MLDYDVGVVILGGGRGTRLEPLTLRRAKPAVPVGGKYRLVDIPISNAIHSKMKRMLLLTQFNSHSLHRHIVNTYQFDPFSRGYVQLLAAQQTPSDERWFQGTADAVRQNMSYIDELDSDLVLILAGDHMYRMDYRAMVRDHLTANADITIAVQPCTEEEIADFGALRVDERGRIAEFREKPRSEQERDGMALDPQWMQNRGIPRGKPYLASMGIYLFQKEVLLASLENELIDFGRDVIPRAVDTYTVQAHFFTGYWRDIGTIRAFYDAHMDLVRPSPAFRFDARDWPIYTRSRFLPCARVSNTRFTRTMLADGTSVMDSEIEDAVIGIRTNVFGATIRRTLLMGADEESERPNSPGAPPVGIGEGSIVQDAIIDKNARIGRNVRIINESGVMEADGDGWYIRDGIVCVPKDSVIWDDTVI